MTQFCQLALDFTLHGGKTEALAKAAATLGAAPDAVASGVAGLSNLLMEASKNNLRRGEFALGVIDLPASEAVKEQVCDFYLAHSKEVLAHLASRTMGLPEYQHLDWRLDVELGGRMQRSRVEPKFVVRLDTRSPAPRSRYLEADHAMLKRMIAELSAAEAAVKTTHSQRVARYIR